MPHSRPISLIIVGQTITAVYLILVYVDVEVVVNLTIVSFGGT